HKYIQPVRAATNVADELVEGNYAARTHTSSYGDASSLSNAVNKLARNLQEITSQNKAQRDQLKAVIDNMESGLMLINRKGYVHLINRKFSAMFGKDETTVLGSLYYDIFDEQNIHKVVQRTFLYEEKSKDVFTFGPEQGNTSYEAVAAPVFNESGELQNAVLVFHDITEFKQVEQMRKDFVANVSHEMKTPITSIRGFT